MAGTIWSPDTCGTHPRCEIELDSDPASPTYGEPTKHNRACANHAAAAMDHAAVAAECRKKENARERVRAALSLAAKDVSWSIDPTTRVITVLAPGLTAAQRTAATAALAGTNVILG